MIRRGTVQIPLEKPSYFSFYALLQCGDSEHYWWPAVVHFWPASHIFGRQGAGSNHPWPAGHWCNPQQRFAKLEHKGFEVYSTLQTEPLKSKLESFLGQKTECMHPALPKAELRQCSLNICFTC